MAIKYVYFIRCSDLNSSNGWNGSLIRRFPSLDAAGDYLKQLLDKYPDKTLLDDVDNLNTPVMAKVIVDTGLEKISYSLEYTVERTPSSQDFPY